MKKILILKAGESLPELVARVGDFEDWILTGMELDRTDARIVSIHEGEIPPDFSQITGIVITGSHTPVMNQEEWSEKVASWLVKAIGHQVPILGICFGHQLLAYALGCRIGDTPRGPEYGTISITLTETAAEDPLFKSFPEQITVQSSHYQAVLDLPKRVTLLAFSEKDPYTAVRYRPHVWGVQFHPEFDPKITAVYIQENQERILQSGEDVNLLLKACGDTDSGKIILRKFAEICQRNDN